MTFDDYKNGEWKVLPDPGPEALCTEGDIVTFDGQVDEQVNEVNVRCKRYEDGQFERPKGDEQEGTIEGVDYVISMTKDMTTEKRRITFTPKPPRSIAGSWTAEDISGGAGGGD